MNISSLIYFVFTQTIHFFIIALGISFLLFLITRKLYSRKSALAVSSLFLGFSFLFLWSSLVTGKVKTFGPADGPAIPVKNILEFFGKSPDMERVTDIARDPNDLPSPITRVSEDHVKMVLETREVIGKMADGIEFNYWTFNGRVPGPLLRAREGDTVELTLKNNPTSIHHHSIDLHAVTGPGGGATVTNTAPGESKTFTFKALNPGLYVYHCATPNVASHMTHGLYGLILIEPKGGLPKVDKEFYLMQGEFYSTGDLGKNGLQIFDAQKMLDGQPQYIVFNGRLNGAVGKMNIKTGESVRFFVGNGGVNLVSSFHIIGEIFDRVYPEAAIGSGSSLLQNVQSTIIPAGGASIVELKFDVPGKYILVDHALARLDRGAWGTIAATGDQNPEIFSGVADTHSKGH
jgi:nitrite reductase (NO-forming)